jgi:ADP-ribosylglycohydrolase
MFLGLAIGDALGNTSESMHPADRHTCYGETRLRAAFLANCKCDTMAMVEVHRALAKLARC